MKHFQSPAATSSYSPPPRAALHNTAVNSHRRSKNTKGIVLLYLILKFWNTPLLQRFFTIAASPWKSIHDNLNTNGNGNGNGIILLRKIIASRFGICVGSSGNFLAHVLIQSLTKVIQLTRIDQAGIFAVSIPPSIRQWSDNYGSTRKILGNIQQNKEPSIMENMEDIDRVLRYWFGRYNPDKSQKMLWMIGASSREHMERVDAEISNMFRTLSLNLSSNHNGMRDAWCQGTLYGHRGKVAAIVVLDQMSRHIHRHCRTVGEDSGTIPEQKVLDGLGFDIAQRFQRDHADEIACGMVPIPMMIFALMPLRHKSTLQSVGFVQSRVEDMSNLHSMDMENMIRRFRRATNRRMAVLQDEARREGRDTRYDDSAAATEVQEADEDCRGGGEKDQGDSGHANVTTEFLEDDILEFHRFESDMLEASKSPVIKAVVQFLAARGIKPLPSTSSKATKVCRDTPVIVSLSGGVDSMVIVNVLAYLRDECDYRQLYIVAVHIDYGNRPESAAEAAFVEHYAIDILKLNECIVRRINEVTRGVTKRDEYEKFSRNVRYDLYRQTVADCTKVCKKNNPSKDITEVGVMLGHHRGDVVENVISNSNKGCGPLDLSGMTSLSKNDGVTIYRPFLPLEKIDVYTYSHKYGVPYFKDTTPHWSTRGKLRNKLIPLLEDLYGDGCLSNLASLAEESDEARDLFNKTALQPFMDRVQKYPMGVIFCTKEFSDQGSYFWKIVLREMLHSCGLGMFSDKAIASFLKRVFAKKITSGWLQCRKDYAVYLMEDRRVMVLYPDSFPWRKTDQYGSVGEVVPFGKKNRVGPWEISSNITPYIHIEKAFESWEDFMSGNIQYCIEVPKIEGQDLPPLKIVDVFTRQSRPLAWKGLDLRVQTTLPLLGNSVEPSTTENGGEQQKRYAMVKLILKKEEK